MIHFFDIGANTGQAFAAYLCKRPEYDGAHVWCFEPSPRHWSTLLKTATEHAGRYRITLCPFGVGDPGIKSLYLSQSGEGDSFHPELRTHNGTPMVALKSALSVQAAIISLAAFIVANTDARDEVTLKLDCEGTEYFVLNELLARPEAFARCRRIMVEFHILGDEAESNGARDVLCAAYAGAGIVLEPWML